MHGARGRAKARSRILYWFRTPPNVKVGRAALDEEAIRLIEDANPDLTFDWPRILKAQPEPAPEPPQPRRGAPSRGARGARGRPLDEARGRPLDEARGRPSEGGREAAWTARPPDESTAEPAAAAPATASEAWDAASGAPTPEERAGEAPSPPGSELRAAEPASLDGAVPDEPGEIEVDAGPPRLLERPHPVEALIGSEGLALLRARYAELNARLTERIADPVRREELKAQAERLNPDTWVTADEAREGLGRYEAELEAMRAVVGGPRRRRRRGRRGGPPSRGGVY
jgi:hypothetical protein